VDTGYVLGGGLRFGGQEKSRARFVTVEEFCEEKRRGQAQ